MLWTVFIFIIVVLIYLHLVEQYKKGEELEIYEIDYTDCAHLQQVCKSKQPIIFEFSSILPERHTIDDLANKYGKKNVYIKDTHDFYNKSIDTEPNIHRNIGVPLSLESSLKLLTSDTRSHYISDSNSDFINDTFLENHYDELDEFIKPNLTICKTRDLMFGSKNSSTMLQYNTEYNHFLYVTRGKIRVKMTPYKSKKYLYETRDYYSYIFYSPLNIWIIQEEYKDEFERIQFLDFDVLSGNMLFIPPFWWYSIQYEEAETLILSSKYSTMMNVVANSYNLCNYTIMQYTTNVDDTNIKKVIRYNSDGHDDDRGENVNRGKSENGKNDENEEEIIIPVAL
jgi:hypothetical protein